MGQLVVNFFMRACLIIKRRVYLIRNIHVIPNKKIIK